VDGRPRARPPCRFIGKPSFCCPTFSLDSACKMEQPRSARFHLKRWKITIFLLGSLILTVWNLTRSAALLEARHAYLKGNLALCLRNAPKQAVTCFERVLELDPELREMPLSRRLFWSHFADDLIAIHRINDAGRMLTHDA
jgi:hypothetical protein